MRNDLLLVFTCLLLASAACNVTKPGVPLVAEQPAANNQTYKVDYLFEHDGCKVYRFYDRGNYVYFTSCQGEALTYPDSARVIRSTTIRRN